MEHWNEKELNLKDLKKVESLKFCKSDNSWIENYHQGFPAFRIEKGFIAGRWDLPPVDLIKFNIFCFSEKILNDITPTGFRIPHEDDWNKIKLNQKYIDTIFPQRYNGEHNSFLFFSKNDFLPSVEFLNVKPHKSFFIRDLERTIIFSFNNLILNPSNQLEIRKIIDFSGYPRFMMKFIE